MNINCKSLSHKQINEEICAAKDSEIVLKDCLGQRFIAAGLGGKTLHIYGIPGNALGCYLDGTVIRVHGNGQDAIGGTMNEGRIFIHGSCGDAPGYAMRGGKIMTRGDIGYRGGIHMKEYRDKVPVLIVGGNAGSFLGEYQAGGRIIVLGLGVEEKPRVGYFCGTGQHGGKIFLRGKTLTADVPRQVTAKKATAADKEEIRGDLMEFCAEFGGDADEILKDTFFVLTPNTKNPYKQLYTSH